MDLTVFGVGVIIGTGIFVLTGIVAATKARPAVALALRRRRRRLRAGRPLLRRVRLHRPGGRVGAYTFSYASLGELIAWIIGWDLVLEFALGTAAVAVGWSGYCALGDRNVRWSICRRRGGDRSTRPPSTILAACWPRCY